MVIKNYTYWKEREKEIRRNWDQSDSRTQPNEMMHQLDLEKKRYYRERKKERSAE